MEFVLEGKCILEKNARMNKWSGVWERLTFGEHVRNMFIDLVCGYTLRERGSFWGCIYGVMWVCMRWCFF